MRLLSSKKRRLEIGNSFAIAAERWFPRSGGDDGLLNDHSFFKFRADELSIGTRILNLLEDYVS